MKQTNVTSCSHCSEMTEGTCEHEIGQVKEVKLYVHEGVL